MSEQNNKEVETTITAQAEDTPKDKGDVVSRDAYEKLLKEKKNLAERTKALEAEKQEAEKAALKQKEDYKTMYEMTEKKAKELEEEITKTKAEKVKEYKFTALKKEWEKMGLKDSMQAESLFKLVDQDKLKFDDEHKLVLGVEEVAKTIKETFSPLFGASSANANHDAPKGGVANLTIEQWKQMSPADKIKHEADLYKARGITIKK